MWVLVDPKFPLKPRRHAGEDFSVIVATPTGCIFRLALYGVPPTGRLTLGFRGPIVLGGFPPPIEFAPMPRNFFSCKLASLCDNTVGEPAYKDK